MIEMTDKGLPMVQMGIRQNGLKVVELKIAQEGIGIDE